MKYTQNSTNSLNPKMGNLKEFRKVRNERNSKLLVDHKSKNSHHSSTSLVELDSTLLNLGILIEGVPSVINESITEVTNELSGSLNILHDEDLEESNESENLKESRRRDCGKSIESIRDVSESGSIVGDCSGKTDSSLLDKVSYNSKHSNTSVLKLDVTKTIELSLVTISYKSKRIEESKRSLCTKSIIESIKRGGGLCNLGRCESNSRCSKGGEDSKFHDGFIFL
mmetsp:Transcript_15573/g.23220  ORF Transcript_15573/g.23220 Transcript_15573/m.23220 type:complete len:226 (-) Transcript_15573:8-685(-)